MPASEGFGFEPYSPILKGLFLRYPNFILTSVE